MRKLLLVIMLLLLCGCEGNKECIKSHTETRLIFYPNANGGLRMIPTLVTVCDEYKVNDDRNN